MTMVTSPLAHLYEVHQRRRGLLPSTIETRRRALARFARWLDPRLLDEATRDDIEAFLDSRQLGDRSRYVTVSHLGCFYAWAVREGHLAEDPTSRVERPRLRRLLPRPANADDIMAAADLADPRMRCWLLLGALQGLRCQEIAGLHREDVLEHLEVPMLRVRRGKGDKERVVPLNAHVERALAALPAVRTGPLWLRPGGTPYPPATVSRDINAYLRDLGVNATAHQLRHLFGTMVYGTTRDLRMVQELLGHDSPVTTAGYAQAMPVAAAPVVRALELDRRRADPPRRRRTDVDAADVAGL